MDRQLLQFNNGVLAPATDGDMNILSEPPTLHIVADTLPGAYYQAIRAVWERGWQMRTEYDRKDGDGKYIDPPSRDARVLIEVRNPFGQPRYAPLSFSERGVYIAELKGAKDHRVLPLARLLEARRTGQPLTSTEWPYTYHQRIFAHPDMSGEFVNQWELAIERLCQEPISRRAVCSTAIPYVDPYLKEDVPCLREFGLRCTENADGSLTLFANTVWRSRDLYKAWGDNVIAVTFLMQTAAREISQRTGRIVHLGSYADYSQSLHIYGQDFGAVGGDDGKGLDSIFKTFPDKASFLERSLTSDVAQEMLVLPELNNLLTARKIEEWGFTEDERGIIRQLIEEIGNGTLIC